MTAEVAVMNKGAVALAADSKVTVTSGGTTKTYDTVSKLFTLSKVAPVGIMIYGNAEFMRYPWETVIKMYRRQKGDRIEATVAEWSADFFRYLAKFGKISDEDRIANAKSICEAVLHDVIEGFAHSGECDGLPPTSDEYQTALRKVLQDRLTFLSNFKPWATEKSQAAIIAELGPTIAEVIGRFLGEHPDETKQVAVAVLLGTLLFKVSSPQVSGVVIAGFGDDEFFPTLIEHRVDGYVGKTIKRFVIEPVLDVSREEVGFIRAFAQQEMVRRFMDGIDPSYGLYLTNGLPRLVEDNCFSTLDKYGTKRNKIDKVKDEIRSAVNKAVKKFQDDATQFRRGSFTHPVMRMVSVLPKDELAHLAESLVALTSLKRRVSSDTETVGGPIDVALISKGDGFIWIKRKHYFNEELNPQFARTYMDDIRKGDVNAQRGTAQGRRRAASPVASRGKAASKVRGGG